MKTARLLLSAFVCVGPAFAGYTYDYANLLNPYNSSQWTANGTNSASNNMYTSSSSSGGSLILNGALPAPSNNYEVRYTLTLASNSAAGSYISYLRATPGALLASGNTGTFYAVEIAHPTFSGGGCSAALFVHKQTSGTLATPYNTTVPCHSGMVVRTVLLTNNFIIVYIDNLQYVAWQDSSNVIASGQPGVGVIAPTANCYISTIDIGHLDTVAPSAINTQLIGTSSFPTRVDIQFPGVADDPVGIGVAFYQFSRNGAYLASTAEPQFSDTTAVAGTSYTYTVLAVDYHYNYSSVSFTVATPPAGSIDPHEIGVRPTGSYWGANGEQIDMRSGNVNFTLPLFKAVGRGGMGVGFNLSYNSQNWRQDPGGTWQLGRDVGYGYGWQLQVGSLTPVYRDYWTIDHYEFIDSTGAEYRLNVNTNGVWSSQESIYVYYDTTFLPARLCFRDGTFWQLQSLSAGTEQDAGTMYPTLIEDSNGNQIQITYDGAANLGGTNSSARITLVADVRAASQYPNPPTTYSFTYDNGSPIKHLTGVTNTINTAEKYTLNYLSNQPLNSPFSPSTGFGSWTFLSSVVNNIPLTTSFTYDSSGSGELDQVTFPYGGHIRWVYLPFTYSGTRTLREVSGGRALAMSTGATELVYGIGFQTTTNITFHDYSQVDDPDGNSEKAFLFDSTTGDPGFGLQAVLDNRPHHYPNTAGGHYETYTWTTDSAGNPYIGTALITEDHLNSTEISKKNVQTLDQYGNVLQVQVFDYGFGSTPIRTYTNTYVTDSNYTSRYIFNRLQSTSVTDGTYTTSLVTNYYDNNATGITACGAYTLNGNIGGEHDANYGTTFFYRGNVHDAVTPSGTRCLSYDIGGNLLTNNNNGLTTSATVNSSTNYAAPSQITTNTLSSSMTWSTFLGLSSATGPNGDSGSISYDTNARPHTITSPLGAITTFTYNDSASPPTKVATTNSHWVRTTMDGLGRTIKTETGNGTTTVSTVDTQYVPCGCSPLGKVGQVSQPYAPGGTVYWTVYHYDGLGRTTSSVAPDGSTTSYSYSGNTVTVTDPAGKTKTFTMDAFGNLTQVQEPDPSLGTVSTTYTYDMLNHLTKVTMPRGSNTQTRTFNYVSGSAVGIDLVSATNPENGTVTYTYNSDHTLHTKTDAKGQVFTYAYDSLKRLISISVGGTTLRTFMYDSNTLDSTYSGSYTQGRLVAVQNQGFTPNGYVPGNGGSNMTVPQQVTFTEMYAYTQPGQTSGKRLQVQEHFDYYVNNQHQTSTQTMNLDGAYTFDNEGKMATVTYPTTKVYNGSQWVTTTGPTYTYSFDAMDRPTGLKDQSNNTAVSNVTYNPANQLLGISYFGVNESRTYNTLNQMTNLTVGTQMNITYTFPAGTNNGKISSQSNSISGETVTYQYDSLNRLLSASSNKGWSETYGFDGFGNLLSKTSTGGAPTLSQAVNAATNRIVGQNYDANGNQTSSSTGTLTYDAENRVLTAASNGIQYAYDSRNKRIWSATISGANMTQVLTYYGVDGQKLGTYTVSEGPGPGVVIGASVGTLAVFFGGKRIGLTQSGSTGAFTQDRLGSNGSYYPYGEARGTVPQDQVGFATYTNDSATGLQYADQRYYASNWGRFMSPDPYQATSTSPSEPSDPSSWNRYSYTRGDPANYGDPRGLDLIYFGSGDCIVGAGEHVDKTVCDYWGYYPSAGQQGEGLRMGGSSGGKDCNPKGDPVIAKKLAFVVMHIRDASYEAAMIQSDLWKKDLSAPNYIPALTVMFLQWSARESGYGLDPNNVAENNFFGLQNGGVGAWGGNEIACPSNLKTTNACMDSTMSWGDELAAALNSTSGKTGITYIAALEQALLSGADMAGALQAIANNGWNSKDPTYGQDITTGMKIQDVVNCVVGRR